MYESCPLPMGAREILRTVVGSTIHGVHLPGTDDQDLMAIACEPPEYVIGLQFWGTTIQRTKPDGEKSGPGDVDLTIHSLRKYARLCSRGNPTLLLPLFVPDDGVIFCNGVGRRLRELRGMFVSKLAGHAFKGYMQAQRERLAGERGSRHGKPREELIEKHGYDTKYAGHILRLGFQGVELLRSGKITLPMPLEERELVLKVRRGEMSLDWVLAGARELEQKINDLLRNKYVPEEPHYAQIDEFLIEAYERMWK